MKKISSCIAFVVTLLLVPVFIGAAETITLNYTAGNAVHMSAGYKLTQAYAKLGITVNLVPMPAERALQNANSGASDGIVVNTADLNALTGSTYTNLVMVQKPVWYIAAVVYSKSRDFTVNGWQSLRPYRIGYINGNKWVTANTAGMQTVPAPDIFTLMRMLDAGRVDVAVLPKQAGDQALASLGLTGIKSLSPVLMNMPLYHFVNRKHQGKIPALMNAL